MNVKYFALIIFFVFISFPFYAQAQDINNNGSTIPLICKDGVFDIKFQEGRYYRVAVPFYGFKNFLRYPLDSFPTRTKDPFPAAIVSISEDPHEYFWLVQIKHWEGDNSLVLDLHSPSGYERTLSSNEPDSGCNIPFQSVQERFGQWRITPTQPLKPGIYGLFRWAKNNTTKSFLYGFEVVDGGLANATTEPNSVLPTKDHSNLYSNVQGIHLKNGQYVAGKIVNIENEILYIRTNDNKILSFHFLNDVKKFAYK
ncbi:MAG: hypothetical protein PHG54_09720 [Smithellaceae bacterium]|jgi:hypothetical protein|nr:hypothetical protein [Smithellaceae bacterium]NLX51034.1 hypothetical protein [Deltaproteobacteria bacterium]